MIWTSISDSHLTISNQESQDLLISFIDQSKSMGVEKIFLLGDIFDLMVGGHEAYLEAYPHVFGKLAECIRVGIEVNIFEGNHDFHNRELWLKDFKGRFNISSGLNYYTDNKIVKCGERTIYFSHGDDSPIEDGSYRFYRLWIRSSLIESLAKRIVPFKVVDGIGRWASSRSRKYSKNFDSEAVRTKYRNHADYGFKHLNIDTIIHGHSHVQDHYEIDGKSYINNGMSLKTKSAIKITSDSLSFFNL